MAEQQYIFRTTEVAAMIEGCRFNGGVFITKDPETANLLRKSYFFGKSLFEETPKSMNIEEPPVKKPVINPKTKPQTKSKKK